LVTSLKQPAQQPLAVEAYGSWAPSRHCRCCCVPAGRSSQLEHLNDLLALARSNSSASSPSPPPTASSAARSTGCTGAAGSTAASTLPPLPRPLPHAGEASTLCAELKLLLPLHKVRSPAPSARPLLCPLVRRRLPVCQCFQPPQGRPAPGAIPALDWARTSRPAGHPVSQHRQRCRWRGSGPVSGC
jgi:hypothetical protein